MAPLSSCAASVDTPTPSPYATDSRSFQLPITVPWHHGSNRMESISGTIFSVRFKVQNKMNSDFERYGVSAIVADTLSSIRTIGRYGGQRVADTFSLPPYDKRFFCHYFRILPENPNYTSSCEYFNELQTVWMRF